MSKTQNFVNDEALKVAIQRIDNILRDPKLSQLLHADDFESSIETRSPLNDSRWLNCRVVPYGADQKMLLLRDVTERMRLNKIRRDFVANASHELRSPLTVISGYLDAIADDPDRPASWDRPVAQMRSQAFRMRHILKDLLELSRLEGSDSPKEEQPVDVAALISSSIEAQQERANISRITTPNLSNVQLLGSAVEIETVIINLLSNALRHTPADGTIGVIWSSGPDGADLIVTDTGEGIDAELIPRLTERFFRVDKGRGRDDGGTGLGLAIVKHVLLRHDGELIVTSEKGAGSEFRCHFPPSRLIAPDLPESRMQARVSQT